MKKMIMLALSLTAVSALADTEMNPDYANQVICETKVKQMATIGMGLGANFTSQVSVTTGIPTSNKNNQGYFIYKIDFSNPAKAIQGTAIAKSSQSGCNVESFSFDGLGYFGANQICETGVKQMAAIAMGLDADSASQISIRNTGFMADPYTKSFFDYSIGITNSEVGVQGSATAKSDGNGCGVMSIQIDGLL